LHVDDIPMKEKGARSVEKMKRGAYKRQGRNYGMLTGRPQNKKTEWEQKVIPQGKENSGRSWLSNS